MQKQKKILLIKYQLHTIGSTKADTQEVVYFLSYWFLSYFMFFLETVKDIDSSKYIFVQR